jgi:hypothetical protein
MSIILPGLPVLLKSQVRNPFIVPPVSVPITVFIVSSPTWIYIKIKTRNIVIISPAPIIIMRTIPATFPEPPPPTVPEKEVYINVGNNVDIRLRYHDHLWRGDKRNRRREVGLWRVVGIYTLSQCLFLGGITRH